MELNVLVQQSVSYLEQAKKCPKHHVYHTGSLCYLLDFYDFLGDVEKGEEHIHELLALIVEDHGAPVFFPGHMDPMNMSQNVIDTGSAADAISRFAWKHREALSAEAHERIRHALKPVAEKYLAHAALEKHITNQRLWGLTGLASWARYAGEEARWRGVVEASVRQALADMSADGFFYYVPQAAEVGMFAGYAGVSAFYHSRCLAFIRYAAECTGVSLTPYNDALQKADQALVAMYESGGLKDMRIECKRWYWLSEYEVAATGFDTYALMHSSCSAARTLVPHVLTQLEAHWRQGALMSHHGAQTNFQCPIFWTAHLAWLLRVDTIREAWGARRAAAPFTFQMHGKEVFADTTPERRVWVSTLTTARNMTVGVYHNGLPRRYRLRMIVPQLPPRLLFSVRETANHVWCALRGGALSEALARLWQLGLWLLWVPLSVCADHWGQVQSFKLLREGEKEVLEVLVLPGTLYGTLTKVPVTVRIEL